MGAMMKKILCLIVVMMMMAVLGGCARREVPKQAVSVPKIKVIATVYPVYDFVRQVGGDKVEVSMLVPAGAEPHEWEPTAKDLVKIKDAKAVFYQGAGFEHWMEKALTKEILGNAQAVELSKGLPLIKEEEKDEHGDGHLHGAGRENDVDPHLWLDPILAQQEIKIIAEALGSIDPVNKEYYMNNADRYTAELNKLHQEFQAGLNTLKRREIVTSHAAFGYMAKRYGFRQIAIMGISPDAEPTPDKMARIVKAVREYQLKYIFAETVLPTKLADTIARETGAKVLVLHPIDQLTEAEMKAGQNYVSLMRTNLTQLKKALAE
jgi:zinc transport system substrate-binding protein